MVISAWALPKLVIVALKVRGAGWAATMRHHVGGGRAVLEVFFDGNKKGVKNRPNLLEKKRAKKRCRRVC